MTDLPAIDFARLGPPEGARIAVVGGCGGMGRALVRALLATGCKVAVLDLPSSIEAHAPPKEATAISLDASNAEHVARAFATLQRS